MIGAAARRPRSAGAPLAALALALLATAAPLPAAEVEEMLPGRPISLRAAVDETLRGSYRIRLAAEAVANRDGALQESSGLFDGTVFFDASLGSLRREVLSATFDSEVQRRLPLEFLGVATLDDPRGVLDQVADQILASIDRGETLSLLLDDCADGQNRVVVQLEAGGTATVCLNSFGDPSGDIGVVLEGDIDPVPPEIRGLEGLDIDYGNLADLAELERLLGLLDALGDDLAGDIQRDLRAAFNDILRNLADSLRLTAEALRRQREDLGDIPSVEEALDLRLEAGQRWSFRNGVRFTTGLSLTGREDNYGGKARRPELGDQLRPNSFTVSGGLRLDSRLGKGRGRIATAGPEMAGIASLAAARQLLVHSASVEALNTAVAYWRLAGAQARRDHLLESARLQAEVLDAVERLIEAEELPRAEGHRARARFAEVRRQVAAAGRQVVSEQLELLQSMGGSANRIDDAPLAADALGSAAPLVGDLGFWIDESLARRRDLAAAAATARASSILARTAKANLRREVDLSLNLSYAGYFESFDERLFDLEGYREAAGGHLAGPSYGLALRFVLPLRNDTARGRLVQAESALARSLIAERDLERQIRVQLADLAGALAHKEQELARRRESVAAQGRAYEASLALLRAGELSVIDLLTTEQQLTDARLAVAGAEQDVAVLRARILFESGRLLTDPGDLESFTAGELELASAAAGGGERTG